LLCFGLHIFFCYLIFLFFFFYYPSADGPTYDSIIISSDSLDSTCEFDDSSVFLVWALISLALAIIFTSQDKLISASLAVSSISWSRKRLLAFKIRSTKSDELSDSEVLESVWDERGDNELFSFCLTNAFLVLFI